MLKIDQKYVDDIIRVIKLLETTSRNVAPSGSEEKEALKQLRTSLHIAMRLEASTIPPYLAAAWSIQPSPGYQNEEIQELILSVAKEEMLHMMGVANIISATGYVPQIANKNIVLDWGVDTLPVGGHLVLDIAPFSRKVLFDFMKIEQPKNPIHYVVLKTMTARRGPQYATIGEFYDAIIELINSFKDDPFKNGGKYHQIPLIPRMSNIKHHPIDNFIITNKDKAIEILNWIIDQGEGTTDGPMDGDDIPAHYYRFAEIYKEGKLIPDSNQELGYAYDKANNPIKCDFNKVIKFAANPKMSSFPPHSEELEGLEEFNEHYTTMFKELQTFYKNGDVNAVRKSIDTMKLMIDDANYLFGCKPPIGPSFEWFEKPTQNS